MPASSKESQAVIDWRKRMKARLVEAMGGKCVCCGYDRLQGNLVMHHVNANDKTFTISALTTAGWARIVVEAKKCVLLCANCHGEVHANILTIPPDAARFNEAYDTYEGMRTRKATRQEGRIAGAKEASRNQAARKRHLNRAKMHEDDAQADILSPHLGYRPRSLVMPPHLLIPESILPRSKSQCGVCGKEVKREGEKHCSMRCYGLSQRKVERPERSQLIIELSTSSYPKMGKKYGVSANAVWKWVNK